MTRVLAHARARSRPPEGPADLPALAAHVVQAILDGQSADQALSEATLAKSPMRLSSQDRAALGDCVFQVLRHWRLTQAAVAPDALTTQVAVDLQVLVTPWPDGQDKAFRARWAPWVQARLQPQDKERMHLYAQRLKASNAWPMAVQYSVPDWLMQQTQADHPDLDQAFWSALMDRAPVDLRVNIGQCKRTQAQQALADSGVQSQPTPYSSWGLRLTQPTGLTQLPLFQQGHIEIQDEASQLLAALVGARRGQIVVDFCAGAGGKTLALGAMVRGTGQLYAMDVSAARLSAMRPRLERAGLKQVSVLGLQSHHDPRLARLKGKADAVLVDAPCSGLGTLRRAPELKWQVQPEDVTRHAQLQFDILSSAAQLVKPGGRLVYATCSFLREEDEAVALAFDQLHPAWEPVMATDVLDELKCDPQSGLTDVSGRWFRTWPHRHKTDAFFASIWTAR